MYLGIGIASPALIIEQAVHTVKVFPHAQEVIMKVKLKRIPATCTLSGRPMDLRC